MLRGVERRVSVLSSLVDAAQRARQPIDQRSAAHVAQLEVAERAVLDQQLGDAGALAARDVLVVREHVGVTRRT